MAMKNSQETTAPKKSRSHEELMAAENFGSISGNDLYWLLRLVAVEASSQQDFCNRLENLLDERLGSGRNLFTAVFNGDFWYPDAHQSYANYQTWSGGRGVLPGAFGQNNSVGVLVWWW